MSAFAGDIPSRLTTADVWRLLRDGFNANEVAHIGGIAVETAEAMIADARARVPREPPAYAQETHG